MSTVIVPTDFSDNAKKAANYAMSLFDESADVHLINAFQIPHSGATVMISLNEILEKDAIELLTEEKKRLNREFGGNGRLKIAARLGEPESVIRRYAEEVGGELVVMGTKGATGIKGILLGSVASAVLESSRISVLSIPEDSNLELPQSIAFAADEQGLEEMELPEKLVELANFYKAEIHVVNVVGSAKAEEMGVVGEVSSSSINLINGLNHVYHFVEDDDVEHGLESFLQNHQIGLLALLNRKHDLLSRLFNRSTTKNMMLHSKVPILAVPYFPEGG